MQIEITSLKGVEYEGDVRSLNIKTLSGEITVLDHHRPLVSVLKKGTAHVVDAKGNSRDIEIKAGFLEVAPGNKVNILAD